MILRSLLSGLVCLGFTACAGAETEAVKDAAAQPAEAAVVEAVATAEVTAPGLTLADVQANPDAWRLVEPENLVVFETSKGRVVVELLPEVAPVHVARMQDYVKAGLYNGTAFHRVIKGFMAQGGDIEATHGADKMLAPMAGEFTFRRKPAVFVIDPVGPADSATRGLYKGVPIETQAQFLGDMSFDNQVESWIPHCKGVVSTARTDDPNSANAQFFLMTGRAKHLDKAYTAKGRVIAGQDVVDKIKLGRGQDGFPVDNADVLKTAQLASQMPEAGRPVAYVQRTDTPEWQAILTQADKDGTQICDLPPVPAVIG